MGELIVTLCHDGKFDRVMRGREFVSALGGAVFLLKLKAANLEPASRLLPPWRSVALPLCCVLHIND